MYFGAFDSIEMTMYIKMKKKNKVEFSDEIDNSRLM